MRENKSVNHRWHVGRLLRFGVLVFSLAFIGIGLVRREQWEVLGKAVKICLECIGIG